MTRAEDADRDLEALYARVPVIPCKWLCADACGAVDGGIRERVRMARAGVKLPTLQEGKAIASRHRARTGTPYECPALVDGRCDVYEVRPMICRAWGVTEGMVCPYGCAEGVRILTLAEFAALMDAANKAGTIHEPLSVEDIAHQFATRPGLEETIRKMFVAVAYTPLNDYGPA